MEKRTFTRQSASIAGTLTIEDRGQFDCVISDFSQGGMLVRLKGARQSGTIRAHLREAGNHATVTFQLPEGPVSVDVSAIHMSRDGIGLQLTHRDARFLPSVQRAARWWP